MRLGPFKLRTSEAQLKFTGSYQKKYKDNQNLLLSLGDNWRITRNINETTVASIDFFNSSSDKKLSQQLVECLKCKLIYVNPRISNDLINKSYSYIFYFSEILCHSVSARKQSVLHSRPRPRPDHYNSCQSKCGCPGKGDPDFACTHRH